MQRSATTWTAKIALVTTTLVAIAATGCAETIPAPAPPMIGIIDNLNAAVATAILLRERAEARQGEVSFRLKAAQTAAACELAGSHICSSVKGAGFRYRQALVAAREAEAEYEHSTDEIDNCTRVITAVTAALEAIERTVTR
jgi:hypothetical protein